MKNLFCIILLIPIMSYSQIIIDGIGPFRLGKSTSSIVEEISKEKKVKIKTSTSLMDTYGSPGFVDKKTKNIYILGSKEDNNMVNPKYRHNPDTKVYFIDYYEISGVPVVQLYLSFYKDTLYSIYSNGGAKISEAMEFKYGKPETKTETKKVKCTGRLSGEFEVEENSYKSEWNSGLDSVDVVSYLSSYYDSKCEKQYLSFFYITNMSREEYLRKDEIAYREKLDQQTNTEKKKALSGF